MTVEPEVTDALPDKPPVHQKGSLAIIERAVELKLPAAELEKLVGLHERLEAARALAAYNCSMRDAQAEMEIVVRDATNDQTKSMYAKLETVQKVAKPVYTRHGFSLSFSEADSPLPNHKRTICTIRHVEGHIDHAQVDLPVDGIGPKGNPIGGMNAVQGAVSTGSYGQRRLVTWIFNLTIAGEDNDGNRTAMADENQLKEVDDLLRTLAFDRADYFKWLKLDALENLTKVQYETIMGQYRAEWQAAKRKAGKK
jgi:hypothetical protein